MGLKLKSAFLTRFLLPLMAILLIFGCASIQRPMGGPRDRNPPKLLLATPPNETRNFKGTEIRLDFDEYFKLANPFQEITLSPAMEKPPEYKTKQKSLLIQFKDTLQKNTTYVINFGKAIADVNEGNVMKNFTYVFSTGNHIDSLNISGTVINNLTQEKEKEATVMLFPIKQDSIMFGKKKPYIFTTTDSSGNFSLANLHEGDYRIYALKEQAANKIYDNDAELIAFNKKPVHLTTDTSGLQLTLFKQEPDKFRVIDKKFDSDGKMFFTFNKQLTDPGVKINLPLGLDEQKIVDFSKLKDSAMIYVKNMDYDSVSVSFTDKGKILDTVVIRKGRKETFVRNISLLYNINNDAKLKPGNDLNLTANTPIMGIDPSRIILLEDSVNKTNFTITKDPANFKKIVIKYRWRQGAKYQVAFNEGTFENLYGDRNKRLIKNFTIDKPENYGTLTLKVTVPDSTKSYIVELLNDQKVLIRTDVIKKKSSIVYKDFITGKYRVRVTYDTNGNGKWDSGNVKRNIYPENIWVSPGIITLRANWEAEEAIEIPREQINP
jgi:hypothetical protein